MMRILSEWRRLAFFSRGGWAPFFADFPPPAALWRWFFPCLAAAFLLRVGAGLSGDFLIRHDELFQYYEQAHRWVFGYGQVHWEYRLGLRSWLLPAFSAFPLWLCKIAGLAHPDAYIPAVKIWHAALSMTIPVGMYFFSRRVFGEAAARLALLFGCFWHEFVIFGAHANAEQYATLVFFAALALLSPSARTGKLLFVGFLLGLTVALRSAYLPMVGVFGLSLLFAFRPRQWALFVAGGLAALVFFGAVDYLSWGRWWHSTRFYFDMFVFNKFSALYVPVHADSFYGTLAAITWRTSTGLYLLALAAFFDFRRYWPLLAPAVVLIVVHQLAADGIVEFEYTNIFMLWPLLWMLIAALLARCVDFPPFRRWRLLPKLIAIWMAAGVVGVVNGLPTRQGEPLYFYTKGGEIQIARFLSRIPPDEMRAVLWLGVISYDAGGYYYLHQRVPNMFSEDALYHHNMIRARLNANAVSPGELNRLVSHIVAPRKATIAGFVRGPLFGDFAVFVADKTPEHPIAFEYFPTDMMLIGWASMEAKAREFGVFFFEPELSWLGEDYAGPFGTEDSSPRDGAAKI